MDNNLKPFKEWLLATRTPSSGEDGDSHEEDRQVEAFPVINFSRPLPRQGTRLVTDVLSPYITLEKVTPAYWRATLSDPPLNPMNSRFFSDYFALIDRIEQDPDVKVVVFDSSSPDFFMGDFDLGPFLSSSSPSSPPPAGSIAGQNLQQLRQQWWPNALRLAHAPVLTIASIRGRCRGGGASFAATLDVRLASRERCVLSHPELGLPGANPGLGALEILPGLVGRSRAMEIVLGADDFDADTAERYGWVNRAVPDAQLTAVVDRLARRVAAWDKPVIARTKALVNRRCVGNPGAEEWLESFDAFVDGVQHSPESHRRMARAFDLGLHSYGELELNLGRHLPTLLER